jgi:hypothetical protein
MLFPKERIRTSLVIGHENELFAEVDEFIYK